jgi:hypothetical protein
LGSGLFEELAGEWEYVIVWWGLVSPNLLNQIRDRKTYSMLSCIGARGISADDVEKGVPSSACILKGIAAVQSMSTLQT